MICGSSRRGNLHRHGLRSREYRRSGSPEKFRCGAVDCVEAVGHCLDLLFQHCEERLGLFGCGGALLVSGGDYLGSLGVRLVDYSGRFLVCLVDDLVERTGGLSGDALAVLEHVGHFLLLSVDTILQVAYLDELALGGGLLLLKLGAHFLDLPVSLGLGSLYAAVGFLGELFSRLSLFVVGAHVRF